MFIYLAIVSIVVAAVVQGDTVDNNLGQDSYESNEFLEEDINRHTKNGSRIIFPGTKWCGPGNNADNDDDLGRFKETDKCCRAHDLCDGIEAGASKHGLKNDSPYSKLHCGCDKAFYKCLQDVDEPQSHIIGELYFIANEKCYKKAYPIIGCENYITFMWMKRCTRYKVDVTQPKQYQFFDLPFYNDIERSLKMARNACHTKSVVYEMTRN